MPRLLVDEVLNPFYLFQVFSMCLWFWDGYQNYAICILVISLAGVIENLYETVHNINSIRKLAHFECRVQIKRHNMNGVFEFKEMSSDDIVPGDIVVVPDNCIMPCDLALLQGQCIVNESMLTGESVPVIKNSLNPFGKEIFDPKLPESKKHTLFSGTKVIQARQIA
jgi:P-type E1-E2 ATPase